MNDELIASNQKDDLAGLPTPREGYQWVKKSWPSDDFEPGDYTLNGDDEPVLIETEFHKGWAAHIGKFYRQVPTPEPEGPEVIWEGLWEDYELRVLSNGEVQERAYNNAPWGITTGGTLHVVASTLASLYAKDKANTALLDKFFELGERAEKWMNWHIDGGQDDTTEPECLNDIIDDFVEAYKEAKGDAKQDV